jgi:peroxiredoxin
VRKYEGRPFVLLGVNEDNDLKSLQEAEKKHNLNWRSWWDMDQMIAQQWRLEGLPTLYLIDAKGIVRWKSSFPLDEDEMDQRIKALVEEAENKK